MKKNNKLKLIFLRDIMTNETDKEHPLTTEQLLSKLEELDIKCDRRTLSEDIKCLNSIGTGISSCQSGHKKGYYIEERGFSKSELRILLDAVAASNFITQEKTDELSDRIVALAGSYKAQVLKKPRRIVNRCKHNNESIYESIDIIEQAIEQTKKISFKYFQLDEKKRREFKKKERYILDPLDLVIEDGNYYLVAYNPKYSNTNNYRLDRMVEVELEDESISSNARELKIGDYKSSSFKMFNGEKKLVKLEFERKCLNAVYDKFGEGVAVKTLTGDKRRVGVMVQISPTFYGWVFQFKGDMRIVEPSEVVEEYKKILKRIYDDMEKKGV